MLAEKELALWAETYERDLNILISDMELASMEKSRIFLSMDFCDIFEHCIPSIDLFMGKPFDNFKRMSEQFLMREVTRNWILYNNSIYNKSSDMLVLLPPYFAEAYDFLRNYEEYLWRIKSLYYDEEKRRYIENILSEFKGIDITNLDDIGRYRLLNRLSRKILHLIFIFSPVFNQGSNAMREMLKTKMNPFPKEIPNFKNIIYQAYEKDNYKLCNVFGEDRPDKLMQNYRDSRALQYTEEINKNLGSHDILILISSSPAVINISNDILNGSYSDLGITCQKVIDGKAYKTVRNLDAFKFEMLELSDNSRNKTHLSQLKEDLKLVRKFLSICEGDPVTVQGGRIRDYIEDDIRRRFLEFAQIKKEKYETNLIDLTRKHYKDKGHIYIMEGKFVEEELISGLKALMDTFGSHEFVKILDQKRAEIEGCRQEILLWFKNYYENLNLAELSRQQEPIGDLNNRIEKWLNRSNIKEIKKYILSEGMEFPENAKMIHINGKWIFYDLSRSDVLYIIEKSNFKQIFYYYKINPRLIDLAFYQIAKKMAFQAIAENDIDSEYVIRVIETLIKPLSRISGLESLKQIANHYNILTKKVHIINTYKDFGLDFSKFIWVDL